MSTRAQTVAVVTGASGAIGGAICRALAAQGHGIVGVYRNGGGPAADVAASIGESVPVRMVQADLSNRSGPEKVIAAAKELGTPNILVNNAGSMTRRLVHEMTDDEWDQSITLNLTAAFRLTRGLLPDMVAAQHGRIVNIASQAAYRGSVGRAHYASAKAGLLGLTYSLARELGADNVTVNAVVPGRITSEMLLNHSQGHMERWMEETPLHRLGTPEEVASSVAFLTSSGASYITGAALQVGGGLVMG